MPSKTASRLATVQGSTLTNYGKIQLFLIPTKTMEQNKLLSKPFKQIFKIIDIKHKIIGVPFIIKYMPTRTMNQTTKGLTTKIIKIDHEITHEIETQTISIDKETITNHLIGLKHVITNLKTNIEVTHQKLKGKKIK